MPQYHDKKNWNNRGAVKITSTGFRSISIVRNLIPYHVGDKVKFHIHIEKPNTRNLELFSHYVYEKFENGTIRKLPDSINGTDGDFEGNIISTSGDIDYSIGPELHYGFPESIITARVNNWDTVVQSWVWMILAALVGGSCSLVTAIMIGFLNIDPAWNIWIPEWIMKWLR